MSCYYLKCLVRIRCNKHRCGPFVGVSFYLLMSEEKDSIKRARIVVVYVKAKRTTLFSVFADLIEKLQTVNSLPSDCPRGEINDSVVALLWSPYNFFLVSVLDDRLTVSTFFFGETSQSLV